MQSPAPVGAGVSPSAWPSVCWPSWSYSTWRCFSPVAPISDCRTISSGRPCRWLPPSPWPLPPPLHRNHSTPFPPAPAAPKPALEVENLAGGAQPEGALSETFVDDDSRGMFHNAQEYDALYPDRATVPAAYCAPRRDDGYAVDAARRKAVSEALSVLSPGGASDIGRALEAGADALPADAPAGMVVYVGDGWPTVGDATHGSHRTPPAEAKPEGRRPVRANCPACTRRAG